jgi:NAD-dependent SIR2 family protein deacetylase
MLVVGTPAQLYPAAGYISRAKLHGARVCVVNAEADKETELYKIQPGDFAFGSDSAQILPKLLEPIIGTMQENGDFAS